MTDILLGNEWETVERILSDEALCDHTEEKLLLLEALCIVKSSVVDKVRINRFIKRVEELKREWVDG